MKLKAGARRFKVNKATFKRNDEYCNYNQIYTDFEIIQPDQTDTKIEEQVILVAPILLTHEEIK